MTMLEKAKKELKKYYENPFHTTEWVLKEYNDGFSYTVDVYPEKMDGFPVIFSFSFDKNRKFKRVLWV